LDAGVARSTGGLRMNGIFLRTVLAIIGIVIIWLGLNTAIGGILTLGWQGPSDFVSISDSQAFAVQDNHVRFLGGVWSAVGVFFMLTSISPYRYKNIIFAMIIMNFLGGLFRLTAADQNLLLGAKIGPSLFAELVLFPLLALWIHHFTKDAKHA